MQEPRTGHKLELKVISGELGAWMALGETLIISATHGRLHHSSLPAPGPLQLGARGNQTQGPGSALAGLIWFSLKLLLCEKSIQHVIQICCSEEAGGSSVLAHVSCLNWHIATKCLPSPAFKITVFSQPKISQRHLASTQVLLICINSFHCRKANRE